MPNKLTKIVEDRIKAWELESSVKRISTVLGKKLPIITISREFGGRGAALAELLGKKTGLKVWNKDLLLAIADELGSNEEFLQTLDERRREFVEDAVLGFLKNKNTNVNYIRTLIRVVKTIEEHGNAIIVGRGANFICEVPESLHLRVVSPFKKRVSGYAKRKNITETEASRIVKEKDAERSEFVRYNFKRDISSASDYDVFLNSDTYSLEDMMAILLKAYYFKIGRELAILN